MYIYIYMHKYIYIYVYIYIHMSICIYIHFLVFSSIMQHAIWEGLQIQTFQVNDSLKILVCRPTPIPAFDFWVLRCKPGWCLIAECQRQFRSNAKFWNLCWPGLKHQQLLSHTAPVLLTYHEMLMLTEVATYIFYIYAISSKFLNCCKIWNQMCSVEHPHAMASCNNDLDQRMMGNLTSNIHVAINGSFILLLAQLLSGKKTNH